MKAIVGSEIVIENPTRAVMDYIYNLNIDNPEYIKARQRNRFGWQKLPPKINLYKEIKGKYYLPFGTFNDIYKLAPGEQWENKTISDLEAHMEGWIEPFDYQAPAIDNLIKAKNGVLVAPCGSGKTNIGLLVARKLNKPTLWLTHTHELMNQSKARAESFMKGDFGTITEGKVNIGKDITFATVQTMANLDESIYQDQFACIIVDECHHCVGTPTKLMMFYKVVNACKARYKYGMSATIERKDGMEKSLHALLGGIVHEIPRSAVENRTVIAVHEEVPIDLMYCMEDYTSVDGTLDYNALLNMLGASEERNQIIVDKVREAHNQGRKQIVLTHRKKHAEKLCELIGTFCKCNLVIGSISHKKRNFDCDVIVATYALAKEGLDLPYLDTLHLATPQKDKTCTIQCAGRIERVFKGKQQPVIYDYVDYDISYCKMCYTHRKRQLKSR